jgi:hypothetical protein
MLTKVHFVWSIGSTSYKKMYFCWHLQSYIFMSPPLSGRDIYSCTCSVTHVRNSEIKQLPPYNDKLQIKFTFRSGPMIFGRVMALGLWNLAKYLVVTTFISLCLEISTWFLVYECIKMSYRSSLHFVLVQWFLVELWPLVFEIWPNI